MVSDGVPAMPAPRKRKETHCTVCNAVVEDPRPYYRRYRTCRSCASQDRVILNGEPHRFCQQCGKYQHVDCFEGTTRTCRVALARHAERRRQATERRRQVKGINASRRQGNGRTRRLDSPIVYYPRPLHLWSKDPAEVALAEEKQSNMFASVMLCSLKRQRKSHDIHAATPAQGTRQVLNIPPWLSSMLQALTGQPLQHSDVRSNADEVQNNNTDTVTNYNNNTRNNTDSDTSSESETSSESTEDEMVDGPQNGIPNNRGLQDGLVALNRHLESSEAAPCPHSK